MKETSNLNVYGNIVIRNRAYDCEIEKTDYKNRKYYIYLFLYIKLHE